MTNNDDRIEILEDARDKLSEVIDIVREATRGTDEENRAEAYIIPHLGTWLDDHRGSSGTSIESLLEVFRGETDDPEDRDEDDRPRIKISDDGKFAGEAYTLDEILALDDGARKKFYLIHHINVHFTETSKGANLKEFSCADLALAIESAMANEPFPFDNYEESGLDLEKPGSRS